MSNKLTGVINAFNAERGFGFISHTDENRHFVPYFFHVNNMKSGLPEVGARVQFVPTKTSKGYAAIEVEIMQHQAGLESLAGTSADKAGA